MKRIGLYASISLVCLFIGMYSALILLAAKATHVFEGIPPTPLKIRVASGASLIFISVSIGLAILVFRRIKEIKSSPPRKGQFIPSMSHADSRP